MKTLQLSTIVLLLSSAFYSCTKDLSTPTNPSGAADSQGSDKATVSIVGFDINPKPVYESSTVEITGTLQFTRAVNKFNVILEKSTEKNAAGEWINFVETTHKEEVDLGSVGQGKDKQYNTATTFPFKYSFPASELGVSTTGWRVHVVGGDVDNDLVGNATLDILPDPVVCAGLSLEGEVIGAVAPTDGSGLYTFTVQYTVNPCDLKFFMLKTQGGLTNGIEFIEAKDGQARTPGHSTNKIITWIEGEKGGAELPGGNRTYTVKFRKAWDGASEIELTGNWSVSASLVGGGETKTEFPSIIHK